MIRRETDEIRHRVPRVATKARTKIASQGTSRTGRGSAPRATVVNRTSEEIKRHRSKADLEQSPPGIVPKAVRNLEPPHPQRKTRDRDPKANV